MRTTILSCPLCADSAGSRHFYQDRQRDYYRCDNCGLIHVPPWQFLSPGEELAEYDRHRNFPDDPGYREFLGRLFVPLNERLASASHGLDFGSGPGPALSLMFEEAGHRMRLFDPFYAPDQAALSGQYDFITASEVVEHLHDPAAELSRLWSLLKPGGWLGIMTKLALDLEAFANWHYRRDPTHISFFSEATMEWLAGHWRAEVIMSGRDVCLFQKN